MTTSRHLAAPLRARRHWTSDRIISAGLAVTACAGIVGVIGVRSIEDSAAAQQSAPVDAAASDHRGAVVHRTDRGPARRLRRTAAGPRPPSSTPTGPRSSKAAKAMALRHRRHAGAREPRREAGAQARLEAGPQARREAGTQAAVHHEEQLTMAPGERRFRAMGTDCHVLVYAPSAARGAGRPGPRARRAARAVLEPLSARAASSTASTRLAGHGPQPVSADLLLLARSMQQAWLATDGLFDPTVLTSMRALGYDADFVDGGGPAGRRTGRRPAGRGSGNERGDDRRGGVHDLPAVGRGARSGRHRQGTGRRHRRRGAVRGRCPRRSRQPGRRHLPRRRA